MSVAQIGIRARLGLGFGAVIALLIAVAATSLLRLAEFNRGVDKIVRVDMKEMTTGAQAIETILRAANSTGNVFVMDEDKHIRQELAAVRSTRTRVDEILEALDRTVQAGREKALYDAILAARAAYLPHEDEFLRIAEAGDYSSAKDVMLQRTRPAQLKYIDAIHQLALHQVTHVNEEARRTADAYLVTRNLIVLLAVAAVLLAALLSWWITASIVRPIGQAVRLAQRVAEGDLTVQVQARGRDEMGMLLAALGGMTADLRTLVGEVQAGARHVSQSSEQIAQGNADLSQRTEEQASTLEETASSMEELTSTVNQNADTARRASELAAGASNVARKGGEAVAAVVGTMNEITESSRRIAEITGVIDGIAFQTNILALNAAVEAARAGEQGRGFAVVAGEVRNLAQRSAGAAREIKGLIGDSVGKVEAGSRLVHGAGSTMEEIVASVRRVSDLISEIAAASQEQSAGIGQVNGAVTQMEHVVQQNAALVEQASAAAEGMKAQAGGLLHAVARFRLAPDEQVPARPTPRQAGREAIAVQPEAQPAWLPRPAPQRGNGAWREF